MAFFWEQRKVTELFKVTRGYVLAATLTEPVKTDEMPYPVYSSQTKDNGLMGYYKDYLYEDAITWTTDGANAGTVNYRAGKFYCTNVCGVLLSNEVTANQMIAEALNNVAKGYVSYVGNPKLMNNVMADIEIMIPTHAEEREKLSVFFRNLDNLITLHQCKHFSTCNKNRFAWEQRKLGEICSRVQGNDGRMELPTLTISAANGWMKQEDRFTGNIAGKEQKNYTLLHKGELSYNHGNSKLAKYGTVFSLQTYEEALVPRVYHSFKVEIGSADFIEYFFATKMPDRELRKLISSGARMDGLLNIGYDDFMGIKMMFPSVLEQDKIAEYFRAFDHLITLHQSKCDNLKEVKKYMLQNMFI